MIYLITGGPGTGKTSKAVSMILENEDGLFKTELEDGTVVDRPLYFCHIDGLDVKKFKAHELSEQDLQAAPLKDLVPQGSVVIVDECDYTYPVRASGRPVPPYIQTLKELRHEGFTLILMTQHPTMIDIYLRNLVGKHIHLERKPVGTKQYVFYKCVTDLGNPALNSNAQASWYKPSKKSFDYYKSASMHIKFKKTIPKPFLYLIPVFALILWKGLGVYATYNQHVVGSDMVIKEASSPFAAESDPESKTNVSDSRQPEIGGDIKPLDLIPTLSEKPESKPIYNQVRNVKTFEFPKACMKTSSGCNCYSDQATLLPEINEDLCKSYVDNGLPFNPYKDVERESNAAVRDVPNHDSGQVMNLSGQPK